MKLDKSLIIIKIEADLVTIILSRLFRGNKKVDIPH